MLGSRARLALNYYTVRHPCAWMEECRELTLSFIMTSSPCYFFVCWRVMYVIGILWMD